MWRWAKLERETNAVSDLFHRIREAQVAAGEKVVVEDLRRKGLLPSKTGIAINYDEWRMLLREFIDEVAGADADLRVTMEWTMETWLQWLKKKRDAASDDANILTFRIEKGAGSDAANRS